MPDLKSKGQTSDNFCTVRVYIISHLSLSDGCNSFYCFQTFHLFISRGENQTRDSYTARGINAIPDSLLIHFHWGMLGLFGGRKAWSISSHRAESGAQGSQPDTSNKVQTDKNNNRPERADREGSPRAVSLGWRPPGPISTAFTKTCTDAKTKWSERWKFKVAEVVFTALRKFSPGLKNRSFLPQRIQSQKRQKNPVDFYIRVSGKHTCVLLSDLM